MMKKTSRFRWPRWLEDEGYQVYVANDGQAGIEKFINIKPDAIFLDIWLPGMDGLEVIKHILAIDPLQIIIMISGHGSVSAAVSALKAGHMITWKNRSAWTR